jgi:hypothetical protein
MTGRPKTRERREREERERAGKRAKAADAGTKARVVARAKEVGPAAAAAEVGLSPALVRKWCQRQKDPPPSGATVPIVNDPASPSERRRGEAELERAAARRALDMAGVLLGKQLASEARNAATVGAMHADRAMQLEEAARLAESHEIALVQGRGEQVVELVSRMFAAVGLSVPSEVAKAVLRGEEVTPEVAAAAREQVRAKFRGEARAELLAEIEAARLATPALSAGEADDGEDEPVDAEIVEEVESESEPAPDEENGLSWADLPEDWKARFNLQPKLGLYEYEQSLKREDMARRQPRVSAPGRFDAARFTHPGLTGGP